MSPVSGTLPVGYQNDALFSWLLSNGDTFSCYGGEENGEGTCGGSLYRTLRQRRWLLPLWAKSPQHDLPASHGGIVPSVSAFSLMPWTRAIGSGQFREKELLIQYKNSYFAKGQTEKKVLRSITVIEMCRLKYSVTVCGNAESHIMKEGLWARVLGGNLETNPAPRACPIHPGDVTTHSCQAHRCGTHGKQPWPPSSELGGRRKDSSWSSQCLCLPPAPLPPTPSRPPHTLSKAGILHFD